MLTQILFFALIFGCFIVVIIFAIIARKKMQGYREILAGIRPMETKEDDNKKGKRKEQIELELLIISNNKFLRVLGLIDKNLKLKLLFAGLVVFITYIITSDTDQGDALMTFFIALIASIVLPGMITGMVINARVKSIMEDLPGFIDLTAVCVQTGMTIDMALKRVAIDFKVLNPDLTYVMLRILRKAELTSLVVALDELSVSLPTKEIRMFTTVMQQSLNFGSAIYDQLIQLSADIREMQLLRIEEHLGTLSAKMSIPLILFIMFPIIILILAPGFMRVFPQMGF
ncbi:pilus assembly protein TadC [Actinobacillus delphinicola]|uniref:Flp pilus assembly protein n=2 Tax=Actinobacillus delphinicola TaxID=51161 RepID=A0A448TSI6_9PAST|nr:pilus assembly protein TadC [Actinobacillus delphinicola]VEJ08865.1 Flp pilus assembly protein [Actinobacillus delphinicola]